MKSEHIESLVNHHIEILEKTLQVGGKSTLWTIGFDVAIENELRWLKNLAKKIKETTQYEYREQERPSQPAE